MNYISEDIQLEYIEKFGMPIPLGTWHGKKDWLRAEREAIKAIAGKRGPLESSEFPLDCPPGAIL